MKHVYEGELKNAAYEGLYTSDDGLKKAVEAATGVTYQWGKDIDFGRVRITVEQLEEKT